jgi:cobalamin biosynthesis protein CobW
MSVPALIVSGYLGSGKTTLVSHLLEAARRDGVRLAIISNEFGDTGIDRALLDAGQDGFVELDGGCVCCRLSDALSDTVQMILAQARPDRLVLETSGVALPGEIRLNFWRSPLRELISDDVVVVVVDAERLGDPMDETKEQQIEAADLLLLNKTDLVSADEAAGAEALLSRMSGGQPVFRTVRSDIDPVLLFPDARRKAPPAHRHEHDHVQFDSFELSFPDVVTEEAAIGRVTAERALRTKGFIRTPDGVRVIQGVGPRVEVTVPKVPPPADLVGRVVVIRKK